MREGGGGREGGGEERRGRGWKGKREGGRGRKGEREEERERVEGKEGGREGEGLGSKGESRCVHEKEIDGQFDSGGQGYLQCHQSLSEGVLRLIGGIIKLKHINI